MVLEATLICLDNSEYSRNSDFSPSRLEAQQETANLLFGAKTQAHPENAVGLLTLAGKRVDVIIAPTSDMGACVQALYGVQALGVSNFVKGIQTAQLALKHRLNRNQRQRIVVFDADIKELEKLGRYLKKNSVSLDIVSFGEVQRNSEKLQKLYLCVNSNDTSHLVEIDTLTSLSRAVLSSPVVAAEGIPPFAQDGALDEFGVDPATDPELYMALRLSLEDERQRQRQQQQGGMRTGGASQEAVSTAEGPAPAARSMNAEEGVSGSVVNLGSTPMPDLGSEHEASVRDIMAMDIDEELRQALLLSLQDYEAPIEQAQPTQQSTEQQSIGRESTEQQSTMPTEQQSTMPTEQQSTMPTSTSEGTDSQMQNPLGQTQVRQGDTSTSPSVAQELQLEQTAREQSLQSAPTESQTLQEMEQRFHSTEQQQETHDGFATPEERPEDWDVPGLDFSDPAIQQALRLLPKKKEDKKDGQ